MANKCLSAYDITAPCVIAPPSPLNFVNGLVGYIVQTAGSAGNLIFNDCATLAAAGAQNQILTIGYASAAVGDLPIGAGDQPLPISNGLVISEVPTGMVLTVVYTIYVVG
jgi:hypothetical protein